MSEAREVFETEPFVPDDWGIKLKVVQVPNVRLPQDMWFVVSPLREQLGLQAPR